MLFFLIFFLFILLSSFLLTSVLPFWLRRKASKMQKQYEQQTNTQTTQPSFENKKKITKDTGEYVDYVEVND